MTKEEMLMLKGVELDSANDQTLKLVRDDK